MEVPKAMLAGNPELADSYAYVSRTLYGLGHAPRAWSQHLDKWFQSKGYVSLDADSCLYVLYDSTGLGSRAVGAPRTAPFQPAVAPALLLQAGHQRSRKKEVRQSREELFSEWTGVHLRGRYKSNVYNFFSNLG